MPLIPSCPQVISRDGTCLPDLGSREFIRTVVGTLSLSTNFLIEPFLIYPPPLKSQRHYIGFIMYCQAQLDASVFYIRVFAYIAKSGVRPKTLVECFEVDGYDRLPAGLQHLQEVQYLFQIIRDSR